MLTVCAISAARIRDGAYQLVSSRSPGEESPIDHQVLRAAAMAAVPSGPLNRPLEFDDLRAASLMHVLGIQDGDFELVQVMLGRYHGISAYFRFHNERFWPSDLEDWQREERRTLVCLCLPRRS